MIMTAVVVMCSNSKLLSSSPDDRILEYDVDKIVFEEETEFQKVQIYHTKSFGNMLVLDDLQSK